MSEKPNLVSFTSNAADLRLSLLDAGISRVTLMIAAVSQSPILQLLYDDPREALMKAALFIGVQYLGRIKNMTPEECGEFVVGMVKESRAEMAKVEAMDASQFAAIKAEANDFAEDTMRVAKHGRELVQAVEMGDEEAVEQILQAVKEPTSASFGRTSKGERIIMSPSDGKVH